MARLILDAGVLIAADRNDRRAWALKAAAVADDVELDVPATVLAQAWRGPRNANLVRFLRGCRIVPLDEGSAKATGELCARAGTDDVVDASVVASALPDDPIVTDDIDDLALLVRSLPAGAGGPRVRAL